MVHTQARGSLALVALTACMLAGAAATQVRVGLEHDLSKPTYGFQGPSSSAFNYDERHGLQVQGALNDVLGPPIKMANGFNAMLQGSNMAGLGTSLKSGGAVLGFDAKLLEAAGGANMLKGGLLLGGAAATKGAAAALDGLPAKKIASVIEVPVKVVAMKDLLAGKSLVGLGKLKEAEALAVKSKGAAMIKEGEALKAQGLTQVMQGASEGMQNIGNMVQQTTGNAQTAFKLLPIMLDLPMGQAPEQQQQQQHQQQHMDPFHQLHLLPSSSASGGLFSGLSSLLPNLAANEQPGPNRPVSPLHSLFGQNHNGYAAILNSTSPLHNLILHPSTNPFLLPMSGGGPLAQSLAGKQPSLFGPAIGAQQQAQQEQVGLTQVTPGQQQQLPSLIA